MENKITPTLKLIVLNLLFSLNVFTQESTDSEQNIIATFVVRNATLNDVDITKNALYQGQYLVFYSLEGDETIYLANYWPKDNSQSWGETYDFHSEEFPETEEEYETKIFTFNWKYYNSYDENTGTAAVKLVKIYKPNGVAFTMTIIDELMDVSVYKGFMKGAFRID
jgi:hypothetical protein